jgi:hypothetical protein
MRSPRIDFKTSLVRPSPRQHDVRRVFTALPYEYVLEYLQRCVIGIVRVLQMAVLRSGEVTNDLHLHRRHNHRRAGAKDSPPAFCQ